MSKSARESLLFGTIAFALGIGAWELAVRVSGTEVFPAPATVLGTLWELAWDGTLARSIGASLLRVGLGYGAGAILGTTLGLILGHSPMASAVMNPVIQTLRPISPIAWIPISIALFGIGEMATASLIFLATLLSVTTGTTNAIRSVSQIYLHAGRNFGLSSTRIVFTVLVPAALPEILTSLRIALGVAWVVVVAAEMIAVDSGLGYLITDARNAGKRYDLVVGGMLVIGAIGLGIDLLVRRVETIRALRWAYRHH